MWERVIELLGDDQAEMLRKELAGCTLKVPKKVPRVIVIRMMQQQTLAGRYQEIAAKYGLSGRTLRRYELKQRKK